MANHHYGGMSATSGNWRISVTVPFLNEEENLPLLYGRCTKIFQSPTEKKEELVFIDNGSTREHLKWIKQPTENTPSVKYIQPSRKPGLQHAITASRNLCADYAWFGHKIFGNIVKYHLANQHETKK